MPFSASPKPAPSSASPSGIISVPGWAAPIPAPSPTSRNSSARRSRAPNRPDFCPYYLESPSPLPSPRERGEGVSELSSGRCDIEAHLARFGVEGDQEFVGEGDADDLFRLAGQGQTAVAGGEIGIVPAHQLGHDEQSLPRRRPGIERTPLRPPRIGRLPVSLPLSWAIGARPASLLTALPDRVPILGNSAIRSATVRSATPLISRLISRQASASLRHSGSPAISAAMALPIVLIWRATRLSTSTQEASASGLVTRRRWLFCAVRSSVSWRSRGTSAASRCCSSPAGGCGAMALTSAKQRPARGLTIAAGMPAPHSAAKASLSYPPVASNATSATWCCWQKAASAAMPAASLAKRLASPSRPSRTSSAIDETSTP